jgi:hypothetical protein
MRAPHRALGHQRMASTAPILTEAEGALGQGGVPVVNQIINEA